MARHRWARRRFAPHLPARAHLVRRRNRRRRPCRCAGSGFGAERRADQDRLQHGADRPARAPTASRRCSARKIWEEEINAKGGLLGRQVQLINYDDQSNPATVPGIYTKLLDVDKVDLVVGPYATNMNAPAMPVVMQKGKTFISLFALECEQRIPLSEIFLDAAVRPDAEAILHRRLLPDRGGAESQAADRRAHRRGRRVRAQRLRGRARQRQEVRLQDRLRQDLSAGHDRLLADHSRACRPPIPTS